MSYSTGTSPNKYQYHLYQLHALAAMFS